MDRLALFAQTLIFALSVAPALGAQQSRPTEVGVRLKELTAIHGTDPLLAGLSRMVSAASDSPVSEECVAGVSGVGFLVAVCAAGCTCREDEECYRLVMEGVRHLGGSARRIVGTLGSGTSIGEVWPACDQALRAGIPVLVSDVFSTGETCLIVGHDPEEDAVRVLPALDELKDGRPVTLTALERKRPSGLVLLSARPGSTVPTRETAIAALLRLVVNADQPPLVRPCLRYSDPGASAIGSAAYVMIANHIEEPVPRSQGSTTSPWAKGRRFGEWANRRRLGIAYLGQVLALFGPAGRAKIENAMQDFTEEVEHGLEPLEALLPKSGTGWNDVDRTQRAEAGRLVRRAMASYQQGIADIEEALRAEIELPKELAQALFSGDARGNETAVAQAAVAGDESIRVLAIRALVAAPPGAWLEALGQVLESGTSITVDEALAGMRAARTAELPDLILQAIDKRSRQADPANDDVLRRLVAAVDRLEARDAVRVLIRLTRLSTGSSAAGYDVAGGSAALLYKRLGRESRATFLVNLAADDAAVRRHASRYLGELGDRSILPDILNQQTLEAAALRARLGDELGLLTLSEGLSSADNDCRERAETLLVELGAQASGRVRDLLEDTALETKRSAIRVLGQIGGRSELLVLEGLGADHELREQTKQAIESLRRKLASPPR